MHSRLSRHVRFALASAAGAETYYIVLPPAGFDNWGSFSYIVSGALKSPKQVVSEQAAALFRAIKQKSVWLPTLFVFLWQATPSSESAFFFFLTNDIGE